MTNKRSVEGNLEKQTKHKTLFYVTILAMSLISAFCQERKTNDSIANSWASDVQSLQTLAAEFPNIAKTVDQLATELSAENIDVARVDSQFKKIIDAERVHLTENQLAFTFIPLVEATGHLKAAWDWRSIEAASSSTDVIVKLQQVATAAQGTANVFEIIGATDKLDGFVELMQRIGKQDFTTAGDDRKWYREKIIEYRTAMNKTKQTICTDQTALGQLCYSAIFERFARAINDLEAAVN